MNLTKLVLFSVIFQSLCHNWRKIVVYHTEVIPKFFTALEGNAVNAYCGSLSPVEWAIELDDHSLPRNHTITNNTIILKNLSLSDSGTYYCKGKYKDYYQEIKTFNNYMYLIVFRVNQVGLVLPNILEVSEGSTAAITCGSLKQAEWFSKDIRSQEKATIGNTLILYKLKKDQSGPYICRGTEKPRLDEQIRIFHNDAIILVDGFVEVIPSNSLMLTPAQIVLGL